jgi:hypothetical protein
MTPSQNILMITCLLDKHQACLIKIQLELSATQLHDQEEIKSQVQIASISISLIITYRTKYKIIYLQKNLKIN